MSAQFLTAQFLARVWSLDAQLVAAGFHPQSRWWRKGITRFIRAAASGDMKTARKLIRRWVIRAGRRSGKSSTLARLCVAWWKWGPWSVPAGDIAVIPFVSVSKDEASARLRTIALILTVMGEPFEQREDEIETTGERKALFKVFACSAKLAVGFTAIMIVCDEVARWESRETKANPAAEVIGTLAPALATQPYGFMILSSSPWGTDDHHATLFDKGNTADQLVSFAPTWVANPSLSEAETHSLEPDTRIHSREYAAIPGGTVSAALDEADVEACFREAPAVVGGGFVSIDASSLRNDDFAFLSGGASAAGEIVVVGVGGWSGDELRNASMADIVEAIAERARDIGVATIFGDQREEAALRALFDQHGIYLQSYAWSEPSKDRAMQLLRRLMRERKLVLPQHERLKRELTTMKARLVPSGRISYQTNGLDYASSLITLLHARAEGDYIPAIEDDGPAVICIRSERAEGAHRNRSDVVSMRRALTNT